jgi:hypothetical protein
MLIIRFSLGDTLPNTPKGFELGHITVIGESGEATSASRTPDQSMMLVLSIVELLDGISRLLLASTAREYRFVGVDSSFSIIFRKQKACIGVSVDGNLIHTATASSLKMDIERSVEEFIDNNDISQIANNAEANDLDSAIRQFRKLSVV